MLGLRPARGREFEANNEIPGNGQQVILSDRLWRKRFAADPNIIGRKITLDSQPFTVAGVMPPGTEHPGNEYNGVAHGETVDVWWPFTFRGDPEPTRLALSGGHRTFEERRHVRAGASGNERPDRAAGPRASRRTGGLAGAGDSAIPGNRGPQRAPAFGVAGRGGPGAADRLRQRGEPAAGARHGPPARDRRARRAGRGPVAPGAADADREPADRVHRGRPAPWRLRWSGVRTPGGPAAGRFPARRYHSRQCRGVRVYAADRAGHRSPVRTGARFAGCAHRRAGYPARRRTGRRQQPRRICGCAASWWWAK